MNDFLLGLAENVAAGVVTTGAIALIAWFGKIRPHLRAQASHRLDVEHWFAGVHERLDAAGVPDVGQPSESGAHGRTGTFTAVAK